MPQGSYAREAREPHTPVGGVRREKKICKTDSVSPQVSLSVFSCVPDLLFDYSRVLEYAKIWTVLQSRGAGAVLYFERGNENPAGTPLSKPHLSKPKMKLRVLLGRKRETNHKK